MQRVLLKYYPPRLRSNFIFASRAIRSKTHTCVTNFLPSRIFYPWNMHTSGTITQSLIELKNTHTHIYVTQVKKEGIFLLFRGSLKKSRIAKDAKISVKKLTECTAQVKIFTGRFRAQSSREVTKCQRGDSGGSVFPEKFHRVNPRVTSW